MAGSPTARLTAVSLDCADRQWLADFYLALLGGQQLWSKESSAALEVSGVVLVMQLVEGYASPVWRETRSCTWTSPPTTSKRLQSERSRLALHARSSRIGGGGSCSIQPVIRSA